MAWPLKWLPEGLCNSARVLHRTVCASCRAQQVALDCLGLFRSALIGGMLDIHGLPVHVQFHAHGYGLTAHAHTRSG
jgi:hypothetical protein